MVATLDALPFAELHHLHGNLRGLAALSKASHCAVADEAVGEVSVTVRDGTCLQSEVFEFELSIGRMLIEVDVESRMNAHGVTCLRALPRRQPAHGLLWRMANLSRLPA